MATGGQKRTRSERVAALDLSPGQWERTWASLRRRDVLGRIGLAATAAIIMGVVMRAWEPPFAYRTGYTPARDIVARVPFARQNDWRTEEARQRARDGVCFTYVNNPQPLARLRKELRTSVIDPVLAAATLDDLAQHDAELWKQLQPAGGDGSEAPADDEPAYRQFREALAGVEDTKRIDNAITAAFARGVLATLAHEGGNRTTILVHPEDFPNEVTPQQVDDVLIGDGSALRAGLAAEWTSAQLGSEEAADRLFAWIRPRLAKSATLALDATVDTARAMDEAAAAVEPVMEAYPAERLLAKAGEPLDEEKIELLWLEYQASLAPEVRSLPARIARGTAVIAMIFTMFVLCGVYMRYRQSGPLAHWRRLSGILLMAVAAVAVCRLASADAWRGEILPVMLFGMTMAVVYRQELALLLSGALSLIVVLALGYGLHGFLLLMAVTTTANLNTGRIRTRSKLIYVGLFAGLVAVMVDIGVSMVDNQPFGLPALRGAAYHGCWALIGGVLMTCLLPFVEKLFGVLTDLSLLELGDMAHPLLQQLVRRAPSTYNHSVTVGSIAEAAADSIGARGLLVRVGAYFHDIGKMLKPGYFIENQGADPNRHETLVPAMSSLVIVAHIKDGADLARQHHLPQPIIDLVEQHHGTTRVGFFYERATQQKEADPNGGTVDESRYRYPGPKPQTPEAAVLMMADNVESASRTLVDPTPKRIESLVRDVAERRLRDGQFDDSGLTLRELRAIERSMVKSLTSIYHGRIKYPDQKTA